MNTLRISANIALIGVLCTCTSSFGVQSFTFSSVPPPPPPRHTSSTFSSSSLSATSSSSADVDNCDVAVFGGGFGGLYTALAIARQNNNSNNNKCHSNNQKPLDIALIEPTESFVFLPLLYDLTVGTATELEVCPFYQDLLRDTGVRHVRASLKSLSPSLQQATLEQPGAGTSSLNFRAGVLAVGASPDAILASVPGASECAQPFYTAADAKQTRRLLNSLETNMKATTTTHRIAVVGGGYGGVELAACVQRRLPQAQVCLICRTSPMAGTRAERLVQQALEKLGVQIQVGTVQSMEKREEEEDGRIVVQLQGEQQKTDDGTTTTTTTTTPPFDAVLWTAGSVAAEPVPGEGLQVLQKSAQGRLAIDPTLRCIAADVKDKATSSDATTTTNLWALGDCAEIVKDDSSSSVSGRRGELSSVLPKTAQVAMQQSDVVAENLLAQLNAKKGSAGNTKKFVYQDLGSMLTLGGPNAAVLAPKEGSALAPLFGPVLDTVGTALGAADQVLAATMGQNSTVAQKLGLDVTPDALGLSLGSHGLGVSSDDETSSSGTLAGTLAGSARRAVYAVRMPTNSQRAVSFVSAAISTTAALAKEASDMKNRKEGQR